MKAKRLFSLLLVIVMVIGMCPVNAFATEVHSVSDTEMTKQNPNDTAEMQSGSGSMVPRTYASYYSASEQERFLALPPEINASTEAAQAVLLQGLKARQSEMTVSVQVAKSALELNGLTVEDFSLALFEEAMAHSGDPTEGDYLYWQFGYVGYSWSFSLSGGVYDLTITYTVEYYTTAEQEAEVDAAVSVLAEQLHLYDDISDYEKVCNIYDYLCENITYDYENLEDPNHKLKYTAYAALINKTAVCQGYAVLFYRLALTAGIDSRVITGIGNGGPHAWNIVALDGRYYLLDATWDAGMDSYSYFLKSKGDFTDHRANSEYETPEFRQTYPLAAVSYGEEGTGGEDVGQQYAPYLSMYWMDMYYDEEGYLAFDFIGPVTDYFYITPVECYPAIFFVNYYDEDIGWDQMPVLPNFTDGLLVSQLDLSDHNVRPNDFYAPYYVEVTAAEAAWDTVQQVIVELEGETCYMDVEIIRDNIGLYVAPEMTNENYRVDFAYSPENATLWVGLDYGWELLDVAEELYDEEGYEYIAENSHLYSLSEVSNGMAAITLTDEAVASAEEFSIQIFFTMNSDDEEYEDGVWYEISFYCYPDESYAPDNICGPNLTWTFDDGVLTISGQGAMYEDWSFADNPAIKHVVIEEGVTGLSDQAFARCVNLISVTMADTVTTIGDGVFFGCSSLQSVKLSAGLTEITSEMFYFCTSLETIEIPYGVVSIAWGAFVCSGITEIVLPDTVEYIGTSAFGETPLKSIMLSQNLKEIGEIAFWKTNLESIVFPASVEIISVSAFWDCQSLTEIVFLGNAPTIGVDAFHDVTATASYPAGDPTWTEEVKQNYGGNITWSAPCGGEHSYESVVTEPTCTEGGFTTHTCTLCGDTYTDSETEPLGHSYESVVTEPTCTEGGFTTHTCTVCEDTYTDSETDPLGHNYESVVTEPTCTEGGHTTHTCTLCGDTYTDNEQEALGHNWDKATCEEAKTCSVCGLTEGPAAGHSWKDATCEDPKTCSVCGKTEGEPLGHSYESVVTEPTCTEGGFTTHTCTVCEDTYTDSETDPLGHSYESVVTEPTCTEGGFTTHTCTLCGDSYTDGETAALGHSSESVVTEPTCTEGGFTTHTCTLCGDTYTDGETAALGHSYESTVVAPTCIADGYTKHTCAICGDSYTDNVVAAKGHVISDGKCTVCGMGLNGWQQYDGNWYYVENGKLKTGWLVDGGKTYYFGKDGIMVTGLQQIDGKTYFFNAFGQVQTGWKQLDGAWYYLQSDGAAATGVVQVDGGWYGFGTDGVMLFGRQVINDEIYIFGVTGLAKKGWVQENGQWLYLEENGKANVGLKEVDGYWYYFDEQGSMATGWQEINGSRYLFCGSGNARTGWVQTGDEWVYLTEQGQITVGLHKLSGNWYGFDSEGYMATGWLEIDGVEHLFMGNGIARKGWYEEDGQWLYLTEQGVKTTGLRKLSGNWYGFDSEGHMSTGWLEIDGKWHLFSGSGVARKGWVPMGGKWMHMAEDGEMSVGWKTIDGDKYYFDANGYMTTGWQQLDGKWYYMDAEGVAQIGWLTLGSATFYMDETGAMLTGWQTIDGQEYYFNSSGALVE